MARLGRRELLGLMLTWSAWRRARAQDGGVAPLPSEWADLPFRQADSRWGQEVLWRREAVLRADAELNGHDPAHGATLVRAFDDGNTIANEGCLLTCLAMVLRLFEPTASPPWTPSRLRRELDEAHVSTTSGLSLAPLTLDVVSDLTTGAVQLTMKEEYLPGEAGHPPVFARTSALVRAFRALPLEARRDAVLMVKTGTWDDTVASHYLLVHPAWAGKDDDLDVLDPAMPAGLTGRWRLTDSAKVILRDEAIARAWREASIRPTQLAGVWAFTRTSSPGQTRLAQAWADALATGRRR
jgi:hypothetical protein